MTSTQEQSSANETGELMQRFQFWTGASRQRYVHTIYKLLDCPGLSTGNIMLVLRDDDGQRTVLDIFALGLNTPSLNLAEIRHRGATLGANEVHVHLLADSEREAKRIAFDLQCGHFADDDANATMTHH